MLKDVMCRLAGWWIISLVAFGLIALTAPQQISILLYKTLQVTFGIGLAYVADKALFKNVPSMDCLGTDMFAGARVLARAIIVLAVLTALSLGL